jgi:hypothetical protein
MTKNWYEVENVDEIPSPTLLVYPDRIREASCENTQDGSDRANEDRTWD